MLFSREDVAKFISDNFEPAWEMVRAVPLVRIDFGDGNVVTRTLHGNIATYVCTEEGQVLDILPGIYTPAAYLRSLDQFRLLANYVKRLGQDFGHAALKNYHLEQAAALHKNEPPAVFVNEAWMSIRRIEGGVLAVLVPGQKDQHGTSGTSDDLKIELQDDLGNWRLLAEDTRQNETIRRRQIHEKLVEGGKVWPDDIKKWLYKEVLHADLDDPYLGLGSVLFANYPFTDKPD